MKARFVRLWPFLLYLCVSFFLRFWNIQHSLYFIYDQGRDALVLQKLAAGDLVLVGPTTGLGGFFLGPLWYYSGLPGFLISQGNPYGISIWYMLIGFLAIPLYWYLSHILFAEKKWAVICALLLTVIPGSLHANLFIWNPLLSVPLMLGALLSFWKARESRWWYAAGFFFLGLTLQSEFAYAVFFIPVFLLLTPFLRSRWHWMDVFVAVGALGVTGVPQVLFELRNRFIMTSSLLRSMQDTSAQISWGQLFSERPGQLLTQTVRFFTGHETGEVSLLLLVVSMLVIGGVAVVARFWLTSPALTKSPKNSVRFLWQLVSICALIPYPFFMLWRGNHGYFFWYYITSHFIFVVPLMVLGLQSLWNAEFVSNTLRKLFVVRSLGKLLSVVAVAILLVLSWRHWRATVLEVDNQAGLAKMLSAVAQVHAWQIEDQVINPTLQVYTANVYTEQYDYLYSWYGHTHQLPMAKTVRDGSEDFWYIIIESRDTVEPYFFTPWYEKATAGGEKVREMRIGVLTLETWKSTSQATSSGALMQ